MATIAEIEALPHTGQVQRGGGGRGQLMTVVTANHQITGKGASRQAAVDDLYQQALAVLASLEEQPKAKVVRLTVEDVLARLDQAGLTNERTQVVEPDEEGTIPGPVWDGTTLVQVVPCVAECMGSIKPFCDCRCNGANHGVMYAILSGNAVVVPPSPIMMGVKLCQCGCGGTTQRRFVPGHDARYHAAQKRAAALEAVAPAEPSVKQPRAKKPAPVAAPADDLPF